MTTIYDILNMALSRYREGALMEALRLCDLVLREIPDYADALFISGLVQERCGNLPYRGIA